MRQAGVYACLIIRCLCLEVELQSKLDVSWRLGILNNPHVWRVIRGGRRPKVDGVKCIQEVRAELQFEPLSQLEVLLQTDVPVVKSGATQATELGCTGPEGSRWVTIVAGVKPNEPPALS